MLTTRTARWSAVTALVCVIVLVATWFVLVGPRRSEAADLADQEASAESQNIALRAQIRSLKEQFAKLPEKEAELAEIRRQMPKTDDVSDLVRSVSGYANQAGVTLTSIAPGDPTTLTPASGTDPAVVSIPVVIEATGRYVEASLFVKYLQTMQRRFLITEVIASRETADDQGSVTQNTSAATTTASPTAMPTATATATATSTATTSPTTTASRVDSFQIKITAQVFSLVDAPEASAAPSAAATPAPAATTTP